MGRAEAGGFVGKMILSTSSRVWRFEKGKNSKTVLLGLGHLELLLNHREKELNL